VAAEPWYRGVPPADVDLEVGEAVTHRIAWRRGRLVLVDHPDPAGELALVALGAERCPCFEVLEAWRSEADAAAWQSTEWFLRPLDLWRELQAYRAQVRSVRRQTRPAMLSPSSSSLIGVTSPRPPVFGPYSAPDVAGMERELLRRMRERLVSALPTVLLERLAYGLVVRRLRAGEPATDMVRIRLRENVVDALNRCVRAWGPGRRTPAVEVLLWLTTEVPPQVVGLVDHHLGHVSAVLPSRWLTAVHARGLALVDDCFVVDAHLERADRGTVEAVHFEHSGSWGWTPVQRTMGVRRGRNARWHLC